jgi:(p)ppGpp synthase/HD superfamily hydrolase
MMFWHHSANSNHPGPNSKGVALTRIDRAIEFAAKAHHKQYRKSSNVPYISHPYSVAILLKDAGCDEDVVIAGLLHDVVEDTPVTLKDIKLHFGEKVTEIVDGCSEPDRKAPWKERKKHTIQYLKNAPFNIKIVSCADKLHNLRTISSGLQSIGDSFWDRFHKGYDDQRWYYISIAESLFEGLDGQPELSLFQQFKTQVQLLFQSE